jgi:AraC-like DNA-binding protein
VFITGLSTGCPPARFNGHRITDGDFVIHWGQEDKVWHTGEFLKCWVIELPALTAPGHLPFADPSIHSRGSGALMMRHPELREGLRTLSVAAKAMTEFRHPSASTDEFASAFIAHCWKVVERCCRTDIEHAAMLSMSPLLRDFKKAMDLIHRDEDAPHSVASLAAAMRMRERALSECFRHAIGRSPRTYLRLYRLNRARAHILANAETEPNVVTAAALKYGFKHLGRFSAYYRDLFGENPSDTAESVTGPPEAVVRAPRWEGYASIPMR